MSKNLPHLVKSDIIEEIAKEMPSLSHKEIQYATSTLIESLSLALAAGTRIELRGFGSFMLRKYFPLTSHNPKTGEKIPTFERWRPHFKPSKKLKELVQKQ